MPISDGTKQAVRQLAKIVVKGSEPLSHEVMRGGFRSGRIPAHLRQEGDSEDLGYSMWGNEFRAFEEALARLKDEPELEHSAERDIESSLWAFVCEVASEKETQDDAKRRREKVAVFLETLAKPHTPFQVVVPIEYLDVEGPMDIGGVRFERWGAKEVEEWALPPHFTDDFVNKTVAIASAKAGIADKAVDRARVSIDQALNLLRFGYIASIRVHVSDNEVMFRQGRVHFVREEGRPRMLGWDYSSLPAMASFPESSIARVKQSLESIENLLAGERAKSELVKRLSLAVHWLGSAKTHTDYDEKVILLCTALEAVLTDESDRLKGEPIALRAMLLQVAADGYFTPTLPLLTLYKLRSDVIHGSAIGKCEEYHYNYLFGATEPLVVKAIKLVVENPEMTTFKDFRDLIEKPEHVENAVRWFESYGKYGEGIVAAAKRLLHVDASTEMAENGEKPAPNGRSACSLRSD